MKKLCSFAAAVFACIALSAAEDFFDSYVYQHWSTFGGLNGATATDIVQTKDGFINIGTYGGLVRFDGVEFSTIKRGRGNDLKFASVRIVLEGKDGRLWIGSNDDGLQLIQPEGNMMFTTQNGIPNNSIRAIAEDRDANIWVGTVAGVVYLKKNRHLINPQFAAGTVSKGIITTNLFCDRDGRIWLSTENDRGLFIFSDGLFRPVAEMDAIGDYIVKSIGQDQQGNIWIGTESSGLVKIENGSAQKVHTGTLLDRVYANTIYTDLNGVVWFGTTEGLVALSDGKFYECNKEGIRTAKINRFVMDREGNLWIATDRNGIGKLSRARFKMTRNNTITNAIAQDAEDRIWMGTDKGVRCYRYDTEISNRLTEFTKDIRIRHVGIAGNGDILVSCYKKPGQLRYNPRTEEIQSWSTDEGLVGNKVRVAIESYPGELYVGTTTGLSIIHSNGSIKNFKQRQGLENEYIMCIYKDSKGMIWIGTDGGGIYFMRNERILGRITSDNGLIGNVVFKITQERDGAYWICTGNGITRCPYYDSSTDRLPTVFQNVNSDQGLSSDSVFQILPDQNGDIWLVSNYGISSTGFNDLILAAEGKIEQLPIKYYSRNDGLDSNGPTSTALSMTDSRGNLWFTMLDGYSRYNPSEAHVNQINPLICIKSITIDSREYKKADKIELKPGTKRVEIRFTGLSFDAPDRIQFIHNLSRFEDKVSPPSPERIVSYTNLEPGRHEFSVRAINRDGLFSDSSEKITFIQNPYFYQTLWFRPLCAFIIFAFTFTVFYLKERRIKKENIRLEGLVRQRTSELEKEMEKSDGLLHAILPDKIAKELKDGIHSTGENFDDVTMLFSDIVNFTKISSGHTAFEIIYSLNELVSLFDMRAKRMGVEKIKTIGDAYMAGCGFPILNGDHARIMVEFAKGMLEDLRTYNEKALIKFDIRIGLNSGPVSAGVIGKTKFVYDVWGDTVNTASRMESAANPGGIRISQAVYERLKGSGIKFSSPIQCNIKGKGLMTTYDVLLEDEK